MVYSILKNEVESQGAPIQLTVPQEKELLQAYEESLDDTDLINMKDLKEQNRKWLEK